MGVTPGLEGIVDLLIVGGGINGAGIARDAAGRGLSVLLVEREDLAQHTSSASTKLIHGGLRYLEQGSFRLVREGLRERERLLSIAPHLIRPLRFVLPHDRGLRPAWLIRLGLFLYDRLGGLGRLPGSAAVRFAASPLGNALKPGFGRGFTYWDAAVDDSRLVVLNALDATERGAEIRTRTSLVEARRDGGLWQAVAAPAAGTPIAVKARAIVNAAGPWVDRVLAERLGLPSRRPVRLIKGSHFVMPRLYDGEHAHILQNPDRRIVFAIPYEERFTLIGTTDLMHQGEPGAVAISPDEIDYLCRSVGRYFRNPPDPATIVWSYAGLRPLHDDVGAQAATVTRDYALDIDHAPGTAPALSVYGGKITTYRRLAEQVLERLMPLIGRSGPTWTGTTPLPGGDLPAGDPVRFLDSLCAEYPFLPRALAARLARSYGTRAGRILGAARRLDELGEDFGGGLHAAEIEHLVRSEWARTADDILWRRSKLGLHVPSETPDRVARYLGGRP